MRTWDCQGDLEHQAQQNETRQHLHRLYSLIYAYDSIVNILVLQYSIEIKYKDEIFENQDDTGNASPTRVSVLL